MSALGSTPAFSVLFRTSVCSRNCPYCWGGTLSAAYFVLFRTSVCSRSCPYCWGWTPSAAYFVLFRTSVCSRSCPCCWGWTPSSPSTWTSCSWKTGPQRFNTNTFYFICLASGRGFPLCPESFTVFHNDSAAYQDQGETCRIWTLSSLAHCH